MITSKVIEAYLGFLRTNILDTFYIEDFFVYDESLDFGNRAKQYITRQDIFQKLEGSPPDVWALFIWQRTGIQKPPVAGRPVRASLSSLNNGQADGNVQQKLGQIDITVRVVSNSIENAETIEEWLYIKGGETVDFDVNYGGELGIHRCSALPEASTDFEAESLESNGTVSAVTFTVSITYPIYLAPVRVQAIESIQTRLIFNTVVGDGNGVDSNELK